MSCIQYLMKSKIGSLYLVASESGLQGIYWSKQSFPCTKKLTPNLPEHNVLIKAINQLDEYFNGKRKSFDLSLSPEGTPFQRKVWSELANIPFGKTVSYKYIAQKIRNPRAVRAVGTANGKNPFCIVIPCHRVIAADGTIGGYGGGLRIKRKLLALEQC